MNFWAPSAANFRALRPGELFLFKLHAPRNVIVGGGVFTYRRTAPIKRPKLDGFTEIDHAPGHAQADFGKVLVVIGGVEQKAHFSAWTCRTAMPVTFAPTCGLQTLIDRVVVESNGRLEKVLSAVWCSSPRRLSVDV